MATDGGGTGPGGRLQRWFDWLTALPPDEAALFRGDVIATVMLRPVALLLSSAGILLMSGAAMVLLQRPWAVAWFVADLLLLALRMTVAVRYQRPGTRMPEGVAQLTICLTAVVLMVFGLGCAASFHTAIRPVPMIATTSMMALIAGLATRWAALPRLAIPAITVLAAMFLTAILTADAGHFRAGALQFAVVTAGTAALTLQNHRALVAMFRAERRARDLAMTDVLTGLPNRGGLIARLDGRRDASSLALLFVDMDGFKAVNDRHGHAAGDRVLVETAARLAATAAPHFTCRLGGDEFVVMISGPEVASASTTARRIADALAEPFEDIAAEPILAGASVGIAFASTTVCDPEQVLAEADRALYLAKRAGGGCEVVIDSAALSAAA
ncbi:MAG TPA: GGDEF domain-containing protein [Sphingomonas sp.]|nr:GGDEF domain-containing protein [Sphingomonas sp.]